MVAKIHTKLSLMVIHYSESKIRFYHSTCNNLYWVYCVFIVFNLYLYAIQKTKKDDISIFQILENRSWLKNEYNSKSYQKSRVKGDWMASWQGILRIYKKKINNKFIILDVRDAMLNKDKILNFLISGVEVSKEENL